MAKKAQNRDQMEAEYIRELQDEVGSIAKDFRPIHKRLQAVSHKLHHFDGKRYNLYKNVMESIRRRLYFGSEFYSHYLSVELERMHAELATVRETIENIMLEDAMDEEQEE